MDKNLFESQVGHLVAKVKRNLISHWGKRSDQVTNELFYEAFSYALREEVMTNWAACFRTYQEKNSRILYYISMEYLPGKILCNTIKSLKIEDVAREAMKRLNRNYDEIMHKEREPGLGNGGLGRLASCFLDSLATLKIPTIGYGLRYQYGTFEQEICYGSQLERPDRWLLHPYPWDFRRDDRAYIVKLGGRISEVENSINEKCHNLHDCEEVRAVPYDIPIVGHSSKPDFTVATMRLWSTKESPRNFRLQVFNAGKVDEAAENTLLTDVLYPNDNHDTGKRFRLKQEFLLVSASLQDIYSRHLACNSDLKNLSDKICIQINDTHPALLVAEMMRTLIKNHQFSWDEAWQTTTSCINFTNHTVLAEALEEWKISRLQQMLPRQYAIIERINEQFKNSLPDKFKEPKAFSKIAIIDHEHVRMANLAIFGSTKVNGVAKLHTEILKDKVFKNFHNLYPDKFLNITNGVTPRRWLIHCNPLLTQFISKRIGDEWQYDFNQISKLHNFANDSETQKEFIDIKKQNKDLCSNYIKKYNAQFRAYDPFVEEMTPLGNDSLYDMHIKRIHEYKRQLLKLVHAIIIYQELLENPQSRKIKRTLFFGGKAAPGYDKARDLIYAIHFIAKHINQDPRTNNQLKILFVENYNVTKAEILIPAADLSEQVSLAGKEASGTGNMKLSMNGALTIGTEDGANIEMREAVTDKWWPFRFGSTKEEIENFREKMSYDPQKIYQENPKIKMALDALNNNTFAENDFEKQVTHQLYHYLLEGFNPDPYFVLHDLESYYQTQIKVEELYSKPHEWAKFAIHNIASMSPFSSDVSIKNYAENVWKINPEKIAPETLKQIKEEFDANSLYTKHNKTL
ncbi:MAG: Maltodextrin phosphorylase [Chlamydiae bacterium]|nr:Maltodextrin phosphorylase [Chlamydiota bacterium]